MKFILNWVDIEWDFFLVFKRGKVNVVLMGWKIKWIFIEVIDSWGPKRFFILRV